VARAPPQRNCFFIAYEPTNANASSSPSSSRINARNTKQELQGKSSLGMTSFQVKAKPKTKPKNKFAQLLNALNVD